MELADFGLDFEVKRCKPNGFIALPVIIVAIVAFGKAFANQTECVWSCVRLVRIRGYFDGVHGAAGGSSSQKWRELVQGPRLYVSNRNQVATLFVCQHPLFVNERHDRLEHMHLTAERDSWDELHL